MLPKKHCEAQSGVLVGTDRWRNKTFKMSIDKINQAFLQKDVENKFQTKIS